MCLGFYRTVFSARNTALEEPKKHPGGRPTGRAGKSVSLYLSFETISVIEAVTARKGRGEGAKLIDDIVRALQALAER